MTSLYDTLNDRIAKSETTFGKADTDDVRHMADDLFAEMGVVPEWTIETTRDREGNTLWEVSICFDGEIILNDWFVTAESAQAYVAGFNHITKA